MMNRTTIDGYTCEAFGTTIQYNIDHNQPHREPVSPVDRQLRFSLTLGWIETWMGRSRPLCAKRPMMHALTLFFFLFPF